MVPFPTGPRDVVSIPWGDVSTAYRSTGIETITTYTHVRRHGPAVKLARWARPLLRLARTPRVAGPDAVTRAATRYEVWGEVRAGAGQAVSGTLTCPNAYDLTADAVVRIVQRLNGVAPGAHTPATAFGCDFVRELDGVVVHEPTQAK